MISLRRLRDEDCARLLEWRNSPDVAATMLTDHVIEPDEHAAWFEAAKADGEHTYRLVEADGNPSGLAYLTGLDPSNRSCEWGGYVADPTARGRGLGSVSLWYSLHIAFGEFELNRVQVAALVSNTIAIALYEHFGFRREALFREYVWKGGNPQDVIGLALLRDEWDLLLPGVRMKLESRGLLS